MDLINITRITPLRRITKDSSSEEVQIAINHLKKIRDEKIKLEEDLKLSIEVQEESRKEAVALLIEAGIDVPPNLNKPITLESYLRSNKNNRKRKDLDLINEALNQDS